MTHPDAPTGSASDHQPTASATPAEADFATRIDRLGADLAATAAAIDSGDLGLSGAGSAGDLYRDLIRAEISEDAGERIWSSTIALARSLWDADHADASALLVDRIADAVTVPAIFAERVTTARRAAADIQLIRRAEALYEAGEADQALAVARDVFSDGPYAAYPAELAARAKRRRTSRRMSFTAAGVGVAVMVAMIGMAIHTIFIERDLPPVPTLTQQDRDAMRDTIASTARVLRGPDAAEDPAPTDPTLVIPDTPDTPAANTPAQDAPADTDPDPARPGAATPPDPAAPAPQAGPDTAVPPETDATPRPGDAPAPTAAPTPDPTTGNGATPGAGDDTGRVGTDPLAPDASERVYTCALGRKVALEAISIIDARETPSPDAAARLRVFIGQVDAACDQIDISPDDLARVVEMIPATQTRLIVERLTGAQQDPAPDVP